MSRFLWFTVYKDHQGLNCDPVTPPGLSDASVTVQVKSLLILNDLPVFILGLLRIKNVLMD